MFLVPLTGLKWLFTNIFMRASTRVAVNTSVQYLRTVISIIITLYTSRVVLANLGVDDYGIFSLIGGVVALLAFIQNNLSRTTQRFLSYYHGRNDQAMIVKIFNNSVTTQWIISILLCGTLALLTDVVLEHLVSIPSNRQEAAKWVYWLMIASLFVNLQSTPYLATLIARENIVYSSIVQMLDAVLKIPVAVSLIWISGNKLEWYSGMSFLVVALNFLMYYAYCKRKYTECQFFSFRSFDRTLFKEMFSFMGWNVYGTACLAGRTQGTAILLNRFFGTAVNAAFGIGGQVSGQIGFLSNALTTAINPQIIKAEGAGDRKKMFRLSEISCKFSFLLMSVVSIPAIIYMPTLLDIWLEEVPEYTSMFCIAVVLANQIDLLTLNLNTANQAIGNVKVYSICINTIKVLTIPVMWYVLHLGMDPVAAMTVYVAFEALCAITRLVFLHISVHLSIRQYIHNVFFMVIPPVTVNVLACYYASMYLTGWMFLATGCISVIVTGIVTYMAGLRQDERIILSGLVGRIIKRIK